MLRFNIFVKCWEIAGAAILRYFALILSIPAKEEGGFTGPQRVYKYRKISDHQDCGQSSEEIHIIGRN